MEDEILQAHASGANHPRAAAAQHAVALSQRQLTRRASTSSVAFPSFPEDNSTPRSGRFGAAHGPLPAFAAIAHQQRPPQHQHHLQQPNATAMDLDLISLKRDREREGRCAECGAQTHDIRYDEATGRTVKEPLTVDNEIHRGRCLLCHPLPASLPVLHRSTSSNNGASAPPINLISSLSLPMPAASGATSPGTSLSGGGTSGTAAPGGGSPRFGGIQAVRQINSLRSIATVSSCGGTSASVHSEPIITVKPGTRNLPDTIESGSSTTDITPVVVGTGTGGASVDQNAAEEAICALEAESTDLVDIISYMRRFPANAAIQQLGCEKLWIQSWDEENSAAIGRVGGIATIVDAMRRHGDLHRLQQCGCEALQNLALNEYNRDVVSDNGGIVAIVDAMHQHSDVCDVQQRACTALANIANDNADNRATIIDGGGLHAIIQACKNFQEEELLVRSAFQALRVLGYNPSSALSNQEGAVPSSESSANQGTHQPFHTPVPAVVLSADLTSMQDDMMDEDSQDARR